LKDYGINIIIAGSFSDIYYMNCTKNALLPIALEKEDREFLAKYKELEIDLPNQVIKTPDRELHFDIDSTWKNKLVQGLDDIAVTLAYEDQIEQYEQKYQHN
ncbi:3-isopropylmalate dehydratase small subunit, partial [Staphylococcus nepalensis]